MNIKFIGIILSVLFTSNLLSVQFKDIIVQFFQPKGSDIKKAGICNVDFFPSKKGPKKQEPEYLVLVTYSNDTAAAEPAPYQLVKEMKKEGIKEINIGFNNDMCSFLIKYNNDAEIAKLVEYQ